MPERLVLVALVDARSVVEVRAEERAQAFEIGREHAGHLAADRLAAGVRAEIGPGLRLRVVLEVDEEEELVALHRPARPAAVVLVRNVPGVNV